MIHSVEKSKKTKDMTKKKKYNSKVIKNELYLRSNNLTISSLSILVTGSGILNILSMNASLPPIDIESFFFNFFFKHDNTSVPLNI